MVSDDEMAAVSGKPIEEMWAKWYMDSPPVLKPDVRALFEQYSKIPADEVEDHCRRIRDKAWKIYHYPCIGLYRFLDLAIGRHSSYKEVLTRMKTGEQTYLDLGCAFAQDIRRFVADGVDSSKTFGADLRLDFIDLGYELFRDQETLQTKFIEADIFDLDSPLKEIYGQMDIVGSSAFFHLFSWEQQKKVAHQVIKLTRPTSGSMVVGFQVGNSHPDEKRRRDGNGTRYRHNLESWRRMWREVGEEAGVKFEVEGKERPIPNSIGLPTEVGDMILEFTVRRL